MKNEKSKKEEKGILKLTVGERIYTKNILNDFKGSLENLGIVLEDIKKILLTPDEKKKCEYVETVNPNGQTNMTWNPKGSKEVELDLNKITIEYVLKYIQNKDKNGEY